jgi:hypothetical protein
MAAADLALSIMLNLRSLPALPPPARRTKCSATAAESLDVASGSRMTWRHVLGDWLSAPGLAVGHPRKALDLGHRRRVVGRSRGAACEALAGEKGGPTLPML